MNIDKIFKLIEFTNQLRLIKRDVTTNDNGRNENDLEHSFQMALLAWYISDLKKLNLNHEKILKYALVHDLVEVYSGDTSPYGSDQNYINSQKEREKEGLEKLRKEFSDFDSMFEAIDEYEKHEIPEAKFLWALDKLIPSMNVFANDDNYYFNHGITEEKFREVNMKKIGDIEFGKELLDGLIEYYKENQNNFFKNKP